MDSKKALIIRHVAVPMILVKLDAAYKLISDKTLKFKLGNKYDAFVVFVRKSNYHILNLFKKMYGENLDTYNTNHGLREDDMSEIDSVILDYKKSLEVKKPPEIDTTRLNLSKDVTQVVSIGDSVKLILLDSKGRRTEELYTLTDSFSKLTKYKKMLTKFGLGSQIINRSIGTTFKYIVDGEEVTVTVDSIVFSDNYAKRKVEKSIERINTYADRTSIGLGVTKKYTD